MIAKAASLLLCLAGLAHAQDADRRNWFEDPFFQVASGLPGCPVPEGPLLTFDEQRREAHWRAERGTSCWLAGKCRDSSAYRYDKTLAPQVQAALQVVPGVERASVWVVIQRRWVFLQGCVSSADLAARLEAAARAVPEVEAVVPTLDAGATETPSYPALPAR